MAQLAVFIPNFEGGGAERMTLNLIAGFVQRGITVDVVVVRATGRLMDQLPPGVRRHALNTPRTLQSAPALARWLREHRPETLMAVMDAASLAAVWARTLARIPLRLVTVLHNATWMQASVAIPFGQRWLPVCTRGMLWPADAILTVSQGVTDEVRRLFPWLKDRVSTAYNPVVSPDVLTQGALAPEHPWLLQRDVPVIVGVGRLHPAKDFATLIRAFALVRAKRAARLIIYGEGDLRASLQAEIDQLGLQNDAQLPGWTDNPWAAVRAASVFVLSSEYEALPSVLIEALALGTPVAATDCRFGPREVLLGGQLGPLVPVHTPEALAQGIETALDHPTDREARLARAQDFSETACVDRYVQALFPQGTQSRQR